MPIATKVVCFSRLLKCLRSLYGKQCGPRSDCSYRSSLFWVHAVCFYTSFVSNVRQLFVADDISRRHFQMYFFLSALRVKSPVLSAAGHSTAVILLYLVHCLMLLLKNGHRREKTCLWGFANNTCADQPAQSDLRLCYLLFRKYQM